MKTYTINITQRDIANGKPQIVNACPVFMALARKIKNVDSVNDGRVTFWDGRHYSLIPLPTNVGDWINCFDDGKPVNLLQFTFKMP